MSDQPNPGSREAGEAGCTCPVLDNSHGQGYLGGPYFVIREDCPLHHEREAERAAENGESP